MILNRRSEFKGNRQGTPYFMIQHFSLAATDFHCFKQTFYKTLKQLKFVFSFMCYVLIKSISYFYKFHFKLFHNNALNNFIKNVFWFHECIFNSCDFFHVMLFFKHTLAECESKDNAFKELKKSSRYYLFFFKWWAIFTMKFPAFINQISSTM